MKRNTLKFAVVKTLPICISYFFISFGLGIILYKGGWNWIYGLAMSVFIYTGAFQFVLASFMITGASVLTCVMTALFMNSRQLFYGLSFLNDFPKTGKWYPYMIHSLTDETYALYTSLDYPGDVDRQEAMVMIALFAHASWIIGTVAGELTGSFIPSTIQGIDFGLTALFITIVLDQWKGSRNHVPVLVGVAVSVILLLLLGKESFLLPAFIVTTCILISGGIHERK